MKNIVWLVSYPKSGNTWFRIFLANYLKNDSAPVPLENINALSNANSAIDFDDYIGLNPFEMTLDEINLYRPDLYRCLSEEKVGTEEFIYKKTHDAYFLNKQEKAIYPEDVSQGVIYFIRNPLDVCVSFSNHLEIEVDKSLSFLLNEEASIGKTYNTAIRQTLFSWKSHLKSWQQQSEIPVHFIRYEDMIQNTSEAFGSAVKFIGLKYNDERIHKAIKHSEFKQLQRMEQENGFMGLNKHFFWKGKIGNYRDYLSNEQIRQIIDYNYDTMKEFNYIDEKGNLLV